MYYKQCTIIFIRKFINICTHNPLTNMSLIEFFDINPILQSMFCESIKKPKQSNLNPIN